MKYREHNLGRIDACWCEPIALMLCPSCHGMAAYSGEPCERCRRRAYVPFRFQEADRPVWWHADGPEEKKRRREDWWSRNVLGPIAIGLVFVVVPFLLAAVIYLLRRAA